MSSVVCSGVLLCMCFNFYTSVCIFVGTCVYMVCVCVCVCMRGMCVCVFMTGDGVSNSACVHVTD